MLSRDQAVLVIIDIQDILMPKSKEVTWAFLRQSLRLLRAAQALDLPVLVTEQNPERLGTTSEVILDTLGDTPRLPKIEFSCLANEGFRDALEKTGRKQLLLIGMETHVCVMQTALEALERGYEAYVVRDAVVSSRKKEYKAALSRMSQSGAECVTAEMAIFELLRKAGTADFKAVLSLIKE